MTLYIYYIKHIMIYINILLKMNYLNTLEPGLILSDILKKPSDKITYTNFTPHGQTIFVMLLKRAYNNPDDIIINHKVINKNNNIYITGFSKQLGHDITTYSVAYLSKTWCYTKDSKVYAFKTI